MLDDEVLTVVVTLDPQLVGESVERADVGQVEAVPQALGATLGHRPDAQHDAAVAVDEVQRDVAVGEASRRPGGDRVAEQHRVGEAVDADFLARGEGAEHAGENGAHQLGRADPHLGAVGRRRGQARLESRLRIDCVEREVHPDHGAAAAAAADLEAGGEGGDQGQADPQARPVDVGTGTDAHALVADLDRQPVALGEGLDREHSLCALRVGVDDDVHRRLGHDRLQIGDRRLVHPEVLTEARQGVADDGDVLGPSREQHPQLPIDRPWSCSRICPVRWMTMAPLLPEASISIRCLWNFLPRPDSDKPERGSAGRESGVLR